MSAPETPAPSHPVVVGIQRVATGMSILALVLLVVAVVERLQP